MDACLTCGTYNLTLGPCRVRSSTGQGNECLCPKLTLSSAACLLEGPTADSYHHCDSWSASSSVKSKKMHDGTNHMLCMHLQAERL